MNLRESIITFLRDQGVSLEHYGVASAAWEIPCPLAGTCAVRESIIMRKPTRIGSLLHLRPQKISTRVVSGGCSRSHPDCPERRKPAHQEWDLS